MKSFFTTRLLIIVFCIGATLLQAQTDGFHFKHVTTVQGLSNNAIVAIHQDKLGHMWFGTRNGLNRYNGVDVKVYRSKPEQKETISSDDILSILEDRDGALWVGTYNGLNKFDPETETFKRYQNQKFQDNIIVNNFVICSTEMPDGELWFGTANGISIYDKSRDRFINTYRGTIKENKKALKNIQRIFCDSSNTVWLGTTTGLVKLVSRQNQNFKFKKIDYKINGRALFIQDIIEIERGVFGIATKYNGFLLFDTAKEKFSRLPFKGLSDKTDVRGLERANDGNLWLGTTSGVYIITPNEKVVHVKENQNTFSGLSQNFIKSIFKDQNGSIWLGTYTGGANIWNKVNENFIRYKNNASNNNVVTSILEDEASNTIYFGTEGGVINKLDKHGNVTKALDVYNERTQQAYSVQAMMKTASNLLWVGVLNHGICVFDLNTKQKRNDIFSEELRALLETVGVCAIKDGGNGIVWIGTFGKGLIRYDTKRRSIFNIERPAINSSLVKTMDIDRDGLIWLGGLGAINRFKFTTEKEYEISKFLKHKPSLRYNIKTVFVDKSNTVWVGTNSRGLQKFDGEKFEPVMFKQDTLYVKTVSAIIDDNEGNLWLTSDKGIIKYNTKTKKATTFNQSSKTSTNEFSPNASLRARNGKIFFGTVEGLITFNPKRIYKNNNAPKVLLSDFKVKNKSVSITPKGSILPKSINHTQTVNLTHENSNFSIRYALPNYKNPENNYYAYRLDGIDEDWVYTNNTEAFYTIQSSGTYKFQVKGANNDGVWNEVPTILNIVVEPAPWLSWWAMAMYSLFIIVVLCSIYWILQSRSRLRHKLQLEYVDNKRNEEINNAKLEFFTNISHEFRTPLTLILGPLQQILEHYDGSIKTFKRLKVIESSTNHLLRLINRLMDFRKLEERQFKLEAAEGNFVQFIQEIFLSFKEHAKIGGYTYTFNSAQDNLPLYFDRYKLERVFYNLISNAFRYTENGGEIHVSVKKAGNEILVEIRDSGVGIAEEHLDKIFDRFFEVAIHNEPEKHYNKGSGIGLSIAHNIVKLHHGTINVENLKPYGALFSVRLKCGTEHLAEEEILQDFKMSDEVTQYVTQLENVESLSPEEILEDLSLEKKKYTLLIVEDNKLLRSFMKQLLKSEYNIIQAENGVKALERAKADVPDLIISDVIMPEMVGTELCAKIKEDIKTSHIPVILLTSRTSLIYKFEGLESGADDYVSKPFNLKEFQLRIKNLLESQERIRAKFEKTNTFSAEDIALTTVDEALLQKAFAIVEANMANEDFDVETFAEELGVSRSLLFTKIKAWTNFTPNEFVRELRLKRAASLLEHKTIRISEISAKVGFKRAKYFSQCFQKKYGLTPTQFSEKFMVNKEV